MRLKQCFQVESKQNSMILCDRLTAVEMEALAVKNYNSCNQTALISKIIDCDMLRLGSVRGSVSELCIEKCTA